LPRFGVVGDGGMSHPSHFTHYHLKGGKPAFQSGSKLPPPNLLLCSVSLVFLV
jgi:hypothetical protein